MSPEPISRAMQMRPLSYLLLSLVTCLTLDMRAGGGALAQSVSMVPGRETGKPLMRFESIKFAEARVRQGPGADYRTKFIIVRRGWPVQVIDELEAWRRIRDADGDEGWVHLTQITSRPTAVAKSGPVALLELPLGGAEHLANIHPGPVMQVKRCRSGWCFVHVSDLEGWVEARGLFGNALEATDSTR